MKVLLCAVPTQPINGKPCVVFLYSKRKEENMTKEGMIELAKEATNKLLDEFEEEKEIEVPEEIMLQSA
jgi:hypothetical protein